VAALLLQRPDGVMRADLIVNADDFGLSDAVNRAVARAFDEGLVRSASLLAGGDAAQDAARIARDRPGLGVGVHLALTQARPVLPPDRLLGLCAGTATLPAGPGELVRRLLSGNVRRAEIVAEFTAQIRRVQDLGVPITHLDGHQHVHLLPVVRFAFAEVARTFDVHRMRMPGLGGPSRSAREWLKALAIDAAGRAARPVFRGMSWPDRFWKLACSGELTRERLLAVLRALGPGTHELMAHPAAFDAGVPEHAAWDYHGDLELDALCDPEAAEVVRARGIRLGNFAEPVATA
jgi:chitin disaccharide deacetylase